MAAPTYHSFNVHACCCPRWLCGGIDGLCCCRCPRCAPCDLEEHERPGRVVATDCCCHKCISEDNLMETDNAEYRQNATTVTGGYTAPLPAAGAGAAEPAPYPGTSVHGAAAAAAEAVVEAAERRERKRKEMIESMVFWPGCMPERIFDKDPMEAPAPVLSWRQATVIACAVEAVFALASFGFAPFRTGLVRISTGLNAVLLLVAVMGFVAALRHVTLLLFFHSILASCIPALFFVYSGATFAALAARDEEPLEGLGPFVMLILFVFFAVDIVVAWFTWGHARALVVWRARIAAGQDGRVADAAGMGAPVAAMGQGAVEPGQGRTLRARDRPGPGPGPGQGQREGGAVAVEVVGPVSGGTATL